MLPYIAILTLLVSGGWLISKARRRVRSGRVRFERNAVALVGGNGSMTDGRDRLADGIWIENHDRLIGWGTYEELASHPLVTTRDVECPNPLFLQEQFTIERPVILGGLQIKTLGCLGIGRLREDAPRRALPVTRFHASDIRIGADGMAALEALQAHFTERWGEPDHVSANQDCHAFAWQRGSQRVDLMLWKKANGASRWRPGCDLNIQHAPDLDPYYSDDYQRALTLHPQLEWMTWPLPFKLQSSYISSPEARYMPPCFEQQAPAGATLLVWRDDASARIGFADGRFALIYPASDVTGIDVTVRLWRGEIAEGLLSVGLRGRPDRISVGSCGHEQAEQLAGQIGAGIAQCLRVPMTTGRYNETY